MAELNPEIRKNLKRIKRIIGVYSGKGGVGKTTIAINIAAYLADQGYRVCLLDADIDCPNVARALGLAGDLDIDVLDKRIIPHKSHNLRVVSMASLQDTEDEAIMWRGPMVTDMLLKFLGTTVWGTADYLIMDLPPGTSDIPITILNMVKPHGIVLVTTPRSIAEVDARKSANLARKTGVQILGVVENMSGGVFGSGKGHECAHTIEAPYLGAVNFDKMFMTSIDEGYPAVLKHERAKKEIGEIVKNLQHAETHVLGSQLRNPKKNMLAKTKNLMLDFKDELLDRYGNKRVYEKE